MVLPLRDMGSTSLFGWLETVHVDLELASPLAGRSACLGSDVTESCDAMAILLHASLRSSAALAIATKTRSLVMGSAYRDMPVAARIALRIAGAVGQIGDSPRPVAPYGPKGTEFSSSSTANSGTSAAVGMRYECRSTLVVWPASTTSSSMRLCPMA